MKNAVLATIFLYLCVSVLSAQVPQKISIQGVLADEEGMAYPDDVYAFTYRLYTTPVSGIVAWSETQNVRVSNGLFNALLGEINPLDIVFNRTFYLGFSVNGGPELEPRIELAAVPYSLMAQSVAPGAITIASLGTNIIDISHIIPNIVSSINGVSNDGGNINLVAGANISIVPDDFTNSITISAANQGGGNPGILQINEGNAIRVLGSTGPTSTISVAPNSITDNEVENNSLTSLSLAPGSVGNSELQSNAVTLDKIAPNILSSIDGVSNDGGNINLVAGANISISPDNINKTITISAADPGGGNPGILRINPGNAIRVSDPDGPTTTISVLDNSIGTRELESQVEFGPDGFVGIRNSSNRLVAGLGVNTLEGGLLNVSNRNGVDVGRLSMDGDNHGTFGLANAVGRVYAEMYYNSSGNNGVFAIYNRNGNESAIITEVNGSGFVGIADPQGNALAFMESNALDRGSFNVVNSNLSLVSQMSEDGQGNGFLGIGNRNELPIVSMYATDQLDGAFYLYNNVGINSIELSTAFAGGGGRATLYNRNGDRVLELAEDIQNASGIFSLYDANEQLKMGLDISGAASGRLRIFNSLNNNIVNISSDTENGGILAVYNANGGIAGTLSTTGGAGTLNILNPNGSFAAQMSAAQNNGFFRLLGPGQKEKVIGLISNGNGNLYINNNNDKLAAGLSINANGNGSLFVNNSDGSYLGILTSNLADGGGIMEVYNGSETLAARMQSDEDSHGYLELRSAASQIGLVGRWLDNAGNLLLYHEGNYPIVELKANTFGGGRVLTNNASGVEVARMTNVSRGGYISVDNSSGEEIVRLTANNANSGSVTIDNETGTSVAGLTTSSNVNGFVWAGNPAGDQVSRMTVSTGGGGFVAIKNNTGNDVAILTTGSSNDAGYININAASGGELARMSYDADGGGYINIFNTTGNEIARMSTLSGGGGYMSVANSGGIRVAHLGGTNDGNGYMGVFNNAGDRLLDFGRDSDGGGFIGVDNENGAEIIRLSTSSGMDGYFSISNAMGIEKARIRVNDDAGFVGVTGSSGSFQTTMSSLANGAGVVNTYGPNGTDNVIISNSGAVGPNGGAVWLYDDAGTLRGSYTSNGFLGVYGPNGNRIADVGGKSGNINVGSISVYDESGTQQAGFVVDNSGQGVVTADIKNFHMDHPDLNDKEIWYASLEGPEAGAYVRGNATLRQGEAVIHLPEHFAHVAQNEGLTVQLTPLSASSEGLAVIEKSTTVIRVVELRNGKGDYNFDFIVHGVRKGFDDYEVIREKIQPVQGDFPSNGIVPTAGKADKAERKTGTLQGDTIEKSDQGQSSPGSNKRGIEHEEEK